MSEDMYCNFVDSVASDLGLATYITACSLNFSSPNAFLQCSNTISNPSLPLAAFFLNASTLASSTAFLIFCHPPHTAVMRASCWNCVTPGINDGEYVTVSCTLMMLQKVRFVEHMVTFFEAGSTYDVSKTRLVSFPPIMVRSHFGADCLQVMSRSVRSCCLY